MVTVCSCKTFPPEQKGKLMKLRRNKQTNKIGNLKVSHKTLPGSRDRVSNAGGDSSQLSSSIERVFQTTEPPESGADSTFGS